MENLYFQIETIKYEIFQKEIINKKIKELEELLKSPFISNDQTIIIQKKIEELKIESFINNKPTGLERLKKFRLSLGKTSEIEDDIQFIYPNLLESGKNIMVFGERGIGKTLM